MPADIRVQTRRAFTELVEQTSDPHAVVRCDSDRSIIDYLQFAALFCKDAIDNVDFMHYVPMLWLWVVLSCYERVTYSPSLRSNSCNASFTFLKGEYAGGDGNTEERLIIKFQMSPNADNIVIDNINGYIVNAIAPPNVQKHYMEFIDSCMTYVDTNAQSFDLSSILMASNADVSNASLFNRLDILDKSKEVVKVSLNKSVSNPLSMSDYLLDESVNLNALLSNLRSLFNAMHILGEMSGLTHNDAHLGNVLHDGIEDCFVLIDYGRVLVCPRLMDTHTITDINRALMFERIKAGELKITAANVCGDHPFDFMVDGKDYLQYMHGQLDESASRMIDLIVVGVEDNRLFALRHLFMFDVMAICVNALAHIHFRKLPALYGEMQHFFRAESMTWRRKAYLSYQIPTVPVVIRMIRKTRNILLAGVFWFALVMKYLISTDDENAMLYVTEEIDPDTRDPWYVVNLTNLSDIGILYKSMVLLELPEPARFMKFVEDHQVDIETVCSLLLTSYSTKNFKGGSMERTKKLKKPVIGRTKTQQRYKTRRSLRTALKKASAKMFQAEFDAYSGGKAAAKIKKQRAAASGGGIQQASFQQQNLTDELIYDASIGITNQCPRRAAVGRSAVDIEYVEIPLAKITKK